MTWFCFLGLIAGSLLHAPGESDGREILAHVENEAITRGELQQEVRRALGKQEVSENERAKLEKEMLDLVINRRLVIRYLERTQQAATAQDIDFAFAQFVKQLGRQEKKLADYLEKEHLTESELRRQFAWQLGWSRYLERQLSDDNLQKYFEKNRREFDGTELRVAHILWKVPAGEMAALQTALERAGKVREEITTGKLSFADAAKKHSQAPTASQGGEIGWIRRHEPMPEVFSEAAFALKDGEVSQPIVSAFGAHLIHVLEVKPGQIPWQERREEIAAAVTRYLFTFLATRERMTAKITFENR